MAYGQHVRSIARLAIVGSILYPFTSSPKLTPSGTRAETENRIYDVGKL